MFLFFACISNSNAQVRKTGPEKPRIARGVRSGELTRGETRTLVNQQRAIRNQKKGARADGVVTRQERRQIKKK